MPILATMGLKKIYIAPAMTDGSMPAKGNQWLDLGDVYQDTCNLKDDSPEITEHKSETSSKVITLVGETPTNVELSLMDPDLELLARYFGGTIAGEKGKRTWIQPEEGLFIGCANVRIIPTFEITYSSKGICLVPMTIKFQSNLQASEEMSDPTVA